MSKKLSLAVTLVLSIIIGASAARAAEIKLLTTGAFKPEVLALVPDFEKQTGHKVTVDNGTAGELKKRIEGGEVFDVAVITPDVVDDLIAKGKIAAGSRVALASVGVGVVVKEGAPKPDVSTVEAFKRALLAAKSVAYIDPASGPLGKETPENRDKAREGKDVVRLLAQERSEVGPSGGGPEPR